VSLYTLRGHAATQTETAKLNMMNIPLEMSTENYNFDIIKGKYVRIIDNYLGGF